MQRTYFILLIFILLWMNEVCAQTRQTFRSTDAKINVEELADPALVFLHDDYKQARINFPGGRIDETNLRYNILLDQMQFVSRRGQVQNISVSPVFECIDLDGKTFVYDAREGYLELLHAGEIPLYQKRSIRVTAQPVKRGAYGGTDHTSAIDGVGHYQIDSRVVSLDNPGGQEMEVTLRYTESFFIEKNGHLGQVGNRRQFLREFSEHRSELRSYIRQHDIDFDKPGDLIRLVEYLESLTQQK